MGTEGREHRIIGAELIEEAVGNDFRVYAFSQALGRRQVEQTQRLVKDAPLDLGGDVDLFVVDGPKTVRKRFRAEGDAQLGGLVSEAFSGAADRAGASVLAVY